MIKKVLTIVLAMFCLISSKINAQKNDLTKMNLKGKVKLIKETPYKAVEKSGKIVKEKIDHELTYFNTIITFNEKGNIIERRLWSIDGRIENKTIYKYDEKGKLLEYDKLKPNGDLYEKFTCELDEKGNLVKLDVSNADRSSERRIYTYKYDKKGNIIEEKNYDDGFYMIKTTYKYDKKGNKIEQNNFDSNGNFNSKSTYKYNEKGNKIEWNFFDSQGYFFRRQVYKYTYDKHDNWTQKIEYEDENGVKKPTTIIERTIEYY